jgi:hypothetical protein
MSTQEQKERMPYVTPELEQHEQYVQITGASFGLPGQTALPSLGDDQ